MKATQAQVTIVLGLVAVGALYLIGRKAAGAAGAAVEYGVQQITPWNHDNVFASTVNKVGGALVTDPAGPGKNADGSWTLGGFVFDVQQSGVNPLNFATLPGVLVEGARAAGRALAGAMPGERKTTAADWAQPTQYDALGNVIN